MTMKKILAGVMAAATMMTVSATAFAVEAPEQTKAVTKPGETEYEAGVSVMGAELDVELPGQMKAFINPYGAEVKVSTDETVSKLGVVSYAYEIVNNTKDFGLLIDIKNAKATPSADVALSAPAVAATGLSDKKVALVLTTGDTAAAAVTDANATAAATTAAATQSKQGVFVFTDGADASKTKLANFAYVAAAETAAVKKYIAFQGQVGKKYATADATNGIAVGDAVEWTEEDTLTATYTLKISPAAKKIADSGLAS